MTNKEIVDSLLALLGIIVSWPVILLFVIFLIRDQIPKMAERITEIGPSGIKLAQVEAAQQILQKEVEQIKQDLYFLRPSSALTPELAANLRASLDRFTAYLKTVGFTLSSEPVEVLVTPEEPHNAFYSAEQNRILIGPALARDPDVAIHEYAQHALTLMLPGGEITELRGIQFGLADYYTCSFSGDPKVAEIWQPPYLRNLDNKKTLADIPSDRQQDPRATEEVWGGAFWELRSRLGPERADRVLLKAWSVSDRVIPSLSTFVEQIVAAAANDGGPDMSAEIRDLFEKRGLLMATVVATPEGH